MSAEHEEEERGEHAKMASIGDDSRDDKSQLPGFIHKLLRMLAPGENENTIAWGDNGTTVLIKDRMAFETKVIPQYFKHSNLPSFVRQLNLYGFHKTTQDPDVCEFRHKHFKRDHEHLLQHIRRKQVVEKPDAGCGSIQAGRQPPHRGQQPTHQQHPHLRPTTDLWYDALTDVRMRLTQIETQVMLLEHNRETERNTVIQFMEQCQQHQRLVSERLSRLECILAGSVANLQDQTAAAAKSALPAGSVIGAVSQAFPQASADKQQLVGGKRPRDDDAQISLHAGLLGLSMGRAGGEGGAVGTMVSGLNGSASGTWLKCVVCMYAYLPACMHCMHMSVCACLYL